MKKIVSLLFIVLIFTASNAQNHVLNFDGTDDHVSIPDTSTLDFKRTDSWTIEFWFRTSDPSTLYQGIVAKMGAFSGRVGYDAGMRYGQMWFQVVNEANTNQIRVNSNSTYNDGLYHHFAGTYDGSSMASGVVIYIDGVAVPTTISRDNLTDTILTNFPLTIGSRAGGSDPYIGDVDEVRVWNVVRSASEIASNYQTELSGNEANLVVYYKLDVDSLSCVPDCGPNNLDGQRVGSTGSNNLPVYLTTTPSITDVACGNNEDCGLPVPIGISSINYHSGINIYPNPAFEKVTIAFKDKNQTTVVSLHDVLGNKVFQRSIKGKESIDISNLNSGIYLIKYDTKLGEAAFERLLIH